MAPDDVVEDVADVLRLVERARNRADGVRADLVTSFDELDQLVEHGPRLRDSFGVAVERQTVASKRDRAAEPLAQRVEHTVLDPGELGSHIVGDREHFLHELSVGMTRDAKPSCTRERVSRDERRLSGPPGALTVLELVSKRRFVVGACWASALQGCRERPYQPIWARPRTQQRAAQHVTTTQGFILKRVLTPVRSPNREGSWP